MRSVRIPPSFGSDSGFTLREALFSARLIHFSSSESSHIRYLFYNPNQNCQLVFGGAPKLAVPSDIVAVSLAMLALDPLEADAFTHALASLLSIF